ncbi:MAG: hypothetical protein AB1626_04500 [Candidatus Micrarchaeota archaeon]
MANRAVFFSVDALTHVVRKRGEAVRVARPHAIESLRALYEAGVHLFIVRTAQKAEGESVEAAVRKAKGELIAAGIPLAFFRGVRAVPNPAKSFADAQREDEAQSLSEYSNYSLGWSGSAQAMLLTALLKEHKIHHAVSVAGEDELDHRLAATNYFKSYEAPALKGELAYLRVESPYEGRPQSFKPHFERIRQLLHFE